MVLRKTLYMLGAGTVYFTSIRPQEQGAWRIGKFRNSFFLRLSTDTPISPIQGYRRRRASDQAGRPSNQAGAEKYKLIEIKGAQKRVQILICISHFLLFIP